MKEWKEPSKYSQWSSQVGVLHGFNRKRGRTCRSPPKCGLELVTAVGLSNILFIVKRNPPIVCLKTISSFH